MSYSIDQFKSVVSSKKGFARPNLFRVTLPSFAGHTGTDLNIICKDVQLPGRQIITNERRIGIKNEKIPFGYAVNDVSMTFHVLNDYGVKEYFEVWQSLAANHYTGEVGYQKGSNGYGRQVTIQQLRKVDRVPSYLQASTKSNTLTDRLANKILPRLTDYEVVRDFYNQSPGGELQDVVTYEVKLENAFPTTMTDIALNNELDGIVELNIQLSYTNWTSTTPIASNNVNTSDGNILTGFANSLVNSTKNYIYDKTVGEVNRSINRAVDRVADNIVGFFE